MPVKKRGTSARLAARTAGASPAPRLPAGLRAVPTQERSRRRLETILDAATTLFADQGFEAVTVDAIAKSAGTPIGSVYQFFADKRAVFVALAERSNQRTEEAFEVLARTALAEPRPPWAVMLDAVIDGFALLSAHDPTFRAINRNLGHADLEAEALVHESLVRRATEILALYAPTAAREVRELVATTLVDAVTFTLVLGEHRSRPLRKKLLDETKTMLRLYVAGRLGIGN